MKIREATIEDLATIQGLNKALFDDPTSASDKYADHNWPHSEDGKKLFTESVIGDDAVVYLAEDNDKVLGYLEGNICKPESWRPVIETEIVTFYILPEYRSQGIGKRLVDHFKEWSKSKNAKLIRVNAYATNTRGVEFYEEIGFTQHSIILEIDL